MKKDKVYMLFDGRYLTNKSKSTLYECCDTYDEAKITAKEYGEDTVIVYGEVVNCEIINTRIL